MENGPSDPSIRNGDALHRNKCWRAFSKGECSASDRDGMIPTGTPCLQYITPLWGAEYVRLFGEAVLPALFSDGNLGAIAPHPENVYEIYSTREDFAVLSKMPAFELLTDRVAVKFHSIDGMIRPNSYQTMSICHRIAVTAAELNDRTAVFLPPDALWSDGSLRRMLQILVEGKQVVLVSGFRVRREPFLDEVRSQDEESAGIISISPRELVRIGLRHMHPRSQSLMWNSPIFSSYCPHLYWPVGEDGLYAHCAHAHPLAVRPRIRGKSFDQTIDWNYFSLACPDPEDWYFVRDSDDICVVDLCADSDGGPTPAPRKASVEKVINWAEHSTTAAHRHQFHQPVRFHGSDIEIGAWTIVEDEADRIVAQTVAQLRHSSLHLLIHDPERLKARTLGRLNRVRETLSGRRQSSRMGACCYYLFEAVFGLALRLRRTARSQFSRRLI